MSFAQTNFYKFSVGGGFGSTIVFSDAAKNSFALAGNGNIDYYLTPFVSLGLEAQRGNLKGGEMAPIGNDPNKFKNTYLTMALNGKIYAGEFLSRKDLNHALLKNLRGLYVGTGVGFIKNSVKNYDKGITSVNKDVIFPFSAGINFYFLDKWGYNNFALNINTQSTFSLEDGMDGDLNTSSNFNDIYSYFSVGFKFYLGPKGLDRKR